MESACFLLRSSTLRDSVSIAAEKLSDYIQSRNLVEVYVPSKSRRRDGLHQLLKGCGTLQGAATGGRPYDRSQYLPSQCFEKARGQKQDQPTQRGGVCETLRLSSRQQATPHPPEVQTVRVLCVPAPISPFSGTGVSNPHPPPLGETFVPQALVAIARSCVGPGLLNRRSYVMCASVYATTSHLA